MSQEDRKAIADIIQGAAIIAISLWVMPQHFGWVAIPPILGGLWGAHRFDRGTKSFTNGSPN